MSLPLRSAALVATASVILCTPIVYAPGESRAENAILPPQVTMVIGSSTGGGFDTYGRLTARFLAGKLPGKPTIVVQNMPGAGGIKSLNWLYNTAARDGRHFALISAAAAFAPLLVDRELPYDPAKFTYLLSLNRMNNMLLVWHNTPFHSAEDAFRKEIILGNSSGPSAAIPVVLNRLAGTKFKVIGGYNGTNGMNMALETGEVQASINYEWDSILSSRKEWLDNKKIRIVMQVTMEPVDDPMLKGIPYIGQYVTDPESRDILDILLAKQTLGRPFMGPPEMNAEIAEVYRKALSATVQDPAYLQAAAAANMKIKPTSGKDLTAFMQRIYSIPKSTVRKLHAEIKLAEKGIHKRKAPAKDPAKD